MEPIDPKHALSRRPPGPVVVGESPDAPLDVFVLNESRADALRQPYRRLSLHLLLRFKGTMILVFLATAGAGLALIWTSWQPRYQAKALIEIRALAPRLVVRTDETGMIPQYEQYLRNQVEILHHPTVLEQVLARADVLRTAWYRDASGPAGGPGPAALQAAVAVDQVFGTGLIEVVAEAQLAADTTVLADAVVEEYLRFSRERLSAEDHELLTELTEEETRLEESVSATERVAAEARRSLLTATPDELISQQRLRLAQLESGLEDLDVEIALTRTRLERPGGRDEPQGPTDENAPAEEPIRFDEDPEWRQLQAASTEADAAVEAARARFGPQHWMLRDLEQRAVVRRTALLERETQLLRMAEAALPWPGGVPAAPGALAPFAAPLTRRGLSQVLRQLELRRGLLGERAVALRSGLDADFTTAEQLRGHTADLTRYRERLKAVRDRLAELDEKGRVPAIIQPIGRAALTGEPSDKRMKRSIAALLAALGAAAGCACWRAARSPRVCEADELRRSAPGPLLGTVPLRRPREVDGALCDEAARMLRTALLARLNGQRGCVVQITSAGENTGKSTVAALLARSLALGGQRVLLVDADLRRPSLAQRFEVEPAPGLVNFVVDAALEPQAIRETGTTNLNLLPVGRWERDLSPEVLVNGSFARLLERLRDQYDFVLLDSPPLLATADAAILARCANGTLLVARERHCRRTALVEALAVLSASGGKLLGTVFVGRSHAPEYEYRTYGAIAPASAPQA